MREARIAASAEVHTSKECVRTPARSLNCCKRRSVRESHGGSGSSPSVTNTRSAAAAALLLPLLPGLSCVSASRSSSASLKAPTTSVPPPKELPSKESICRIPSGPASKGPVSATSRPEPNAIARTALPSLAPVRAAAKTTAFESASRAPPPSIDPDVSRQTMIGPPPSAKGVRSRIGGRLLLALGGRAGAAAQPSIPTQARLLSTSRARKRRRAALALGPFIASNARSNGNARAKSDDLTSPPASAGGAFGEIVTPDAKGGGAGSCLGSLPRRGPSGAARRPTSAKKKRKAGRHSTRV
mmetsp:Transcript_460/g.1294  ORF Transcript_460/g.1294 Transcript_460/m.1294 type:complete len:299 (-) Transcript_460:801-1697(-)